MNTHISSGISTKLFAGFHLNSELRMHLNQSKTYKQEKIGSQNDFQEVHYHHKDYFGNYLNQNFISLPELRLLETTMRKKLELYCPGFNTEHATFFILPQVFVK